MKHIRNTRTENNVLARKDPAALKSRWGYTCSRRFLEGLCTGCGGTLELDIRRQSSQTPMRMCKFCRKRNADRARACRDLRIASGLCTRCGKIPPKIGILQCEFCTNYATVSGKKRRQNTFFDRRSRTNGAYSVLGAKILWSLWKQQRGRCALTGMRLTRDNAELDHVIARSKGGSNDRSNLRWLQKDVNQARRSLSDLEFISLCKSVVDHESTAK